MVFLVEISRGNVILGWIVAREGGEEVIWKVEFMYDRSLIRVFSEIWGFFKPRLPV